LVVSNVDPAGVGIVDKWLPLEGTLAAINHSIMEKLFTIAGLCDEETLMFVTSTHWAEIARALKGEHPGTRLNPANFKRLKILKLTIVNSGSEDQEAINLVNKEYAERAHFAYNRENRRVG
jgi:hypothetical protein